MVDPNNTGQANEDQEQIRTVIRSMLEKTDKGGTANTIQNCITVFENDPLFAGKISRNLLTETNDMIGEFPWRRDTTRFDDQDLPHVLLYFEQYYGIRSEKCIDNAFRVAASQHSFHPIQDYLKGLRWDGTSRVKFALHHFLGAEVSDYNEECLRVFMLGAVKRIFEPGAKFDLMLVLTGGQGAGKSTFLRFLAIRDEWFSDDLKKLDDEKIYQRLAGHWILEMSEMVAAANAKSIEDIKSFLSRSKDTYKFPYDRYAADHLRQCVFAGTTNKIDFLPMDRSGNRRFLPVQAHPERAETHILADEAASRAYIDQMWAEIMAIYESGDYSTHLSREMEEKLAQEQERFQQEDTMAGQIYAFMEGFEGDKLCSKQLYKEALDHPYDEPKQWETREIFEIVNVGIANGSIPGWRPFANSRRFEKYGTQRGWERLPTEQDTEKASPVNQPVNQPVDNFQQMGFVEVDPDADFPF
ncbi:MAG: virulence-associated protein E [Clostridia bacterium]|nr:virulence-associated protein E [Clostridia bacterium]